MLMPVKDHLDTIETPWLSGYGERFKTVQRCLLNVKSNESMQMMEIVIDLC